MILFLLHSAPYLSPFLSFRLQHFVAYELQTQCLQVAILGWVRLDINGVYELLYCVFSLEFVHSSSSCSRDGKQHKPMTNNPAKTPGWFQEWIPIMQSHVGRRSDSQWQLYVCACVFSPSVTSNSLWPCGLQPARLLVHGIVQARILEWVAISSSRGSYNLGIKPSSPVSAALAGRFFSTEPPGKKCAYDFYRDKWTVDKGVLHPLQKCFSVCAK